MCYDPVTSSKLASSRRRTRLAVPAALFVTAALLAACGKKGDPLPPVQVIPAATDDLAFYQLGEQLFLRLGYPKTTTAGLPLPGLERVEVFRMTRPLAGEAPPPAEELPAVSAKEFEVAAMPYVRLEGPELTSAIEGDRIVARLPLETLDGPALHVYAVRTVAEGGEASAWSNLVRLVPQTPPAPPSGLTVTPQADGVLVEWNAEPSEGVEGFHLYRRPAVSRIYGEPVRFVGADTRSLIDRDAVFGERYIYTLTTVGSRRPRRESAYAEEREVDYQDRFAPSPPPGLQGLAQTGGVRLVWRPSPEPDVAGYKVYREDPGAELRPLTEAPIVDLKFADDGLTPGLTYVYRVTAVDAAGNEGQPATARVTPR